MVRFEKNDFSHIPTSDKTLEYQGAKLKEKSLMNELLELDKAYKAIKDNRIKEYIDTLPETLNLEKIKYKAPTDDKIKSDVETKYSFEYEQNKDKIIQNIEKTRDNLNKNKDNLSKTQKDLMANLDDLYLQAKENMSNQALKRGLSRSSIIMNKITDADLKRAEQADIINKDTRLAIEKLNKEISDLEISKANSLKALDISHAIKVQNTLDKLIEERDEKVADVVEYNNKILEKEQDYQEERYQKIDKYKKKVKEEDKDDEEYYEKHGYYPGMKDEYQKRYAMAYDFYMNLPSDTAKRVLNENANLEKYLGSKFYNKLKTIIVMRK